MNTQLNPLSLPPEDAVRLLSRAGCRIMTMEMLQMDIDSGMPVNEDGTINLVTYMAWMTKEVNGNGDNESGQSQAD
ncbi:MAG: hypothetical protein WC279_13985 [Sulfurimonas sp.]|jgi:hypothetical protein|uniref:hypothetical protein n=1 Tax=Sulfurimonas sp. TaxID=2022749 RepID=UPI00356615D7